MNIFNVERQPAHFLFSENCLKMPESAKSFRHVPESNKFCRKLSISAGSNNFCRWKMFCRKLAKME
jgi:hypothetical protein